MQRNEYLYKNLFGLECPVQDTAYVVYNLYMQNMRHELNGVPSSSTRDRDLATGPDADESEELAQTRSSTLSSSGRQASTILPILLQFVTSVGEMEDLPLTASSQRAARLRFLSSVFASGLPASCRSLVEVLGKLNTKVCEVYVAEVPATQPARQQRLELQAQVRGAISSLKSLRGDFEEALNQISEFADSEAGATDDEAADRNNAQLRAVYDACEKLHSLTIAPRISVAELLCAVRSAIAVRTDEVVAYARKQLTQCFEPATAFMAAKRRRRFAELSDEAVEDLEKALPSMEEAEDVDLWRRKALAVGSLRVLITEIHATTRMKLDAVEHMFGLFAVLRVSGTTASSKPQEGQEAELDDLCNDLLDSGVMDAEAWMLDLVALQRRRDGAPAEPILTHASPSRTASFKGSLSRQGSGQGLLASSSGSSRPPPSPSGSLPYGYGSSSDQLRMSAVRQQGTLSNPPPPSSDIGDLLTQLSRALDDVSVSSAGSATGSVLYDLLGRVNLFLRRHGLAHEAMSSSSSVGGAKYVPVITDDTTTFIPHETDELLGFGKAESELYARACLCHDQLALQCRVQSRLELLASATDAEFFQECHDDLLEGLIKQADEACVVSPARRAVEKRLLQVMVVRLKLFHHSGVVRLVTVPQTVTLDQLRQQWKDELFSDALQCRVFYLDDGDRVMLSTAQEYRDLLRLRRSHVIDGTFAGSASLSGSRSVLSRSAVATSNDLKLELYLDAPSLSPPRATAPGHGIAKQQKPLEAKAAPQSAVPTSAQQPASPAQEKRPPSSQQAVKTSPTRADIFSQLPPGMNINEYIRMLDNSSQVPQASALIERRHAALVGPPAGPPPAASQPVPQPRQPPPASSSAPPATDNQTKNVEARRLFLQMGKQARGVDDAPATAQQPNNSSSSVPEANSSVVVVNPSRSKWAPPRNEQGAVIVAQHTLSDSVLQPQRNPRDAKTEAERYFDDDDDDDGVDQGPSWNRGSDNHVQAVLYGNQPGPGAVLRHNGPLRRSGIPLPQQQQSPPKKGAPSR